MDITSRKTQKKISGRQYGYVQSGGRTVFASITLISEKKKKKCVFGNGGTYKNKANCNFFCAAYDKPGIIMFIDVISI